MYGSYEERTSCMAVMMRGPLVWQLCGEDLLYGSYVERTSCMAVMRRGPLVWQL